MKFLISLCIIILPLAVLSGCSGAVGENPSSQPDTNIDGEISNQSGNTPSAHLPNLPENDEKTDVKPDTTVFADKSRKQPELILSASLDGLPESVLSYRIVSPVVTVESVAELGARLGFTGEAAPIDDGSYIAMSKPETKDHLWVNTSSGAIDYSCPHKLYPLSPDPLPANDEAVDIAIRFLEQIDMYFPDLAANEPVIGGRISGNPAHLLVRFTRYVDGIPLTGMGNKFGVRISDEGEVARALLHYPELEPYKEVSIKAPDQAFNELKSGGGLLPAIEGYFDKVVIDEVSIGYYLESINKKQEFLLPAWTFSGEFQDTEGNYDGDYTDWVMAVE
jgi:hypothetical protein